MTKEEFEKQRQMVLEEQRREREEATTVVIDFQQSDSNIKKLLGEWFKIVKDTKKSVYIKEVGYEKIDSFRIKYEPCEWNEEGDSIYFQDMLGKCPKTLLFVGKTSNRFPQYKTVAKQMFQAIVEDH